MKAAVLGLAAAVMLAGCASTVSSFLGIGAPVTADRCRSMDLEKMGYDDGKLGQRQGEKYEFWVKDCRATGAPFDRAVYDKGYAEGIKYYCSCEAGFASGVRDEYTEIKGQYFTCPRKDYNVFLRGHEAGKKYKEDPTMVKKINHYKNEYFDDVINPKGAEECKAMPPQADEKKPSGTASEPEKPKTP